MKFRPSFFNAVRLYSPEERKIQRRHALIGMPLWILILASAFFGAWWLTISFAAIFYIFVVWSSYRRRQLMAELKRKNN
jgi:uncharacterized protein (DUF58 family)